MRTTSYRGKSVNTSKTIKRGYRIILIKVRTYLFSYSGIDLSNENISLFVVNLFSCVCFCFILVLGFFLTVEKNFHSYTRILLWVVRFWYVPYLQLTLMKYSPGACCFSCILKWHNLFQFIAELITCKGPFYLNVCNKARGITPEIEIAFEV